MIGFRQFVAAAVLVAQGSGTIRICTELFKGGASRPPLQKGTSIPACFWKTRTLTVAFLDGDPRVQAKVRATAEQWTPHSGVNLVFANTANADIRISFKPGGSWSYVGMCQDNLPSAAPTMNFGWLTPTSSDTEISRVVLHEFGHALGLVHEHQNPVAPLRWNIPAVYAYYRNNMGWDSVQTRAQVLTKYATAQTNHSAFDSLSIMAYAIPSELTLDGFGIPWNTALSAEDKRFIKSQYP